MTIRGVIFDFDGVIIDSECWFLASVQRFLKEHGIEVTQDDISDLPGKPVSMINEELQTKYDLADLLKDRMMYDIYNGYQIERPIDPMPGLLEFLKELKDRKIFTALATSAGMEHVTELLDEIGLSDPFDEIVTIADVTNGKPDPEIYLKAIQKLKMYGLQKNEICVIEDSPNGIRSAKAAGLYTFGLKASKVIQDTSQANKECQSFNNILKIMEEL